MQGTRSLNYLTKTEILARFDKLSKLNDSSTVCVSKFHYLKINPFARSIVSCCKAFPENVDLDKISDMDTVDDLIATSQIYEDRKAMLDNRQVSSCEYCWQIENKGDKLSRRHYESIVKYKTKSETVLDVNQKIEYLEVSLSNLCNMRCMYCNSDYSSRIKADLIQNGPFTHARQPILIEKEGLVKEDKEIHRKRLTKSIINSLGNLKSILISGGEPLLDPSVWEILDNIVSPETNPLRVNLVTNLNHQEKTIQKLLDKAKLLLLKGGTFMLVVSCDTIGEEAEIIRDGLDYNLFIKNLELVLGVLKDHNSEVQLHITVNALSIKSKVRWLKTLEHLISTYSNLTLSFSNVDYHDYLTPKALPISCLRNFINEMDDILTTDVLKNRVVNWNVVRDRIEFYIENNNSNNLLPILRQDLLERAARYKKDVSAFTGWIDDFLISSDD